jgi:fibronectin-binding autotransporter adhesin
MKKQSFLKLLVLSLGFAVAGITHTASATDGNWTTPGNYSNSANWAGGTIASGTDATATFSIEGGTGTLDSNQTLGTMTLSMPHPSWNTIFAGSSSSNVLTFAKSSGTPLLATNSWYSGDFYWGNMTIAGNQGLNIQTGYNTILLQTGLSWTATGTLKLQQAGGDGTDVFAQGNNVLPGTMDLNMTNSGATTVLVVNGATTQTIGALMGGANNYIAAYSGANGLHGGDNPTWGGGTNVLGSTTAATLQIGNTSTSGTFGGVIGKSFSGDSSSAAAALNIVKLGISTETLTGANTYTGATTINGGTLAVGSSGSIGSSTLVDIKAGATFNTTSQSFTMLGSQTFKFTLDPAGAGTAALLAAGALNITSGVVDFATVGSLNDAAYVIANYTSLSGATFATVSNLPSGYSINYGYNGGTQIALVVPEPGTFAMLLGGMGMLTLFRRRRA